MGESRFVPVTNTAGETFGVSSIRWESDNGVKSCNITN